MAVINVIFFVSIILFVIAAAMGCLSGLRRGSDH